MLSDSLDSNQSLQQFRLPEVEHEQIDHESLGYGESDLVAARASIASLVEGSPP